MNFYEFAQMLEGKTRRDRAGTRMVYHLNDQGEFKEVMKKQKLGLWVSPNMGQNFNWGGWIAGGSKRNVLYLHKLAIPEWLYDELMDQERGQTRWATDPTRPNERTANVTELVIPPHYWKFIQPVSTKKIFRSDLLKMSNRQRRLEADVEKRPQFRMPTKKYGMDVLPTGEPQPGSFSQEEYQKRKNRDYSL